MSAETIYFGGSITIGIWAKKAGVWQKITQDEVYVSSSQNQTVGTSQIQTFNWNCDNTYQMGTGVQALGITIDAFTGNAAALAAFSDAIFQTQATASSDRSATPAGQKSTVTVNP